MLLCTVELILHPLFYVITSHLPAQ